MSEEEKYCFMHVQKVECIPQCMAYRQRVGGNKASCVLLEVGDAIVGTLVTMANARHQEQERAVKHGTSAPPPEVT